jgi:hypothetical protein
MMIWSLTEVGIDPEEYSGTQFEHHWHMHTVIDFRSRKSKAQSKSDQIQKDSQTSFYMTQFFFIAYSSLEIEMYIFESGHRCFQM